MNKQPTTLQFGIALFVTALCTVYILGSGFLEIEKVPVGENRPVYGFVFWMAVSGLAFLFSIGMHVLLLRKKRSMEAMGEILGEERMLEPFYGAEVRERIGVVVSVTLLSSLPVLIVFLIFRDFHSPWNTIFLGIAGIFVLMLISVYTIILFKKSREFYERYEHYLIPALMFFLFLGFIKYSLSLQNLSLPGGVSWTNILAVAYSAAAIPLGVKLLLSANRTIFDKKAKAEEELNFASEVQQQFLNDRIVDSDSISGFGTSRAAREVGGDFLYLEELEDQSVVAAVGDVSGHSFGAGLIMSMLTTMTEDYMEFMKTPRGLMENLNRKLLNQPKRNLFATMGCIQLHNDKATLWNAGHMPVLKYSLSEKVLTKINPPGFALGMTNKAEYKATEITLNPGDYLVLYSDGLVETREENGQVRGEEHFIATVKSVMEAEETCKSVAESILEKVLEDDFSDYPEDDLTIVIIHKKKGNGAR